MSSWAVDFASALKNLGRSGGPETRVILATVSSIDPVSIRAFDQTIKQRVFVNPAYTLKASDPTGDLFQYDGIGTPPGWFLYLKQYHQQAMLRPGDEVVVLQVDADFYVLEKVAGQ